MVPETGRTSGNSLRVLSGIINNLPELIIEPNLLGSEAFAT